MFEAEGGYFSNTGHRMNYRQMREGGYPIGSGTVESAGKQFKARFAGPGMRWSRCGAERLLSVRTAIPPSSVHASISAGTWPTTRPLSEMHPPHPRRNRHRSLLCYTW